VQKSLIRNLYWQDTLNLIATKSITMKKVIILALPILLLIGCSIHRWEGKSVDSLLSKKGKPDKVEQNGEEQVLYYCKPTKYFREVVERDARGNQIGNATVDTMYNYEVFAVQKSNTIFFASEELSYVAPENFTVIEEE
jgi:hypothetical protein